MKFIKEKFDARYIQRRIREEDAKSDRKVVEVLLSPQEWYEFQCAIGFAPWENYYKVAVCEPMTFSLPCDSITHCDAARVVTIRRG